VQETQVLYPDYGWYRLQARSDNEESEPEVDCDHPNPIGYADDTGGIWLSAITEYGPADITLEVLPVGAEPLLRDGAEVVYDGQFYVEEIDEDTGVIESRQGDLGLITWATRLDWGTWRAVIQAQGREEHFHADLEWYSVDHGDERQPVIEHWWVSIIDTE
jgi:hypothetical protein